MEQVKSKGKLQGFTRAILGAANERADAVHAEADEQERSTIERYRAEAHQRAEQRRSIAQSEIKAREDKRVIFVRRYWYFDSIASLSEKTGYSQGKIKNMLYHMRLKLRAQLESEGVEL